jgi:hypothetical protein
VRLLLLEARDEHAAHGTQALPVIVVATRTIISKWGKFRFSLIAFSFFEMEH